MYYLRFEDRHKVIYDYSFTGYRFRLPFPDEDKIGNFIKKFTTDRLGYFLVRWKNILMQRFMLNRLRRNPEKTKEMLINHVRGHLGEDYDVDKHFTPRYMPWDQRL